MTQRQLTKLTKTWAHRLGIGDWKISVKFMPAEDMEDDQGQCWYYPEYRRADIHILREQDTQEGDDSIEAAVVHELLHIVLEGHRPLEGGKYDAMFERGLNLIANALIEVNSE